MQYKDKQEELALEHPIYWILRTLSGLLKLVVVMSFLAGIIGGVVNAGYPKKVLLWFGGQAVEACQAVRICSTTKPTTAERE